LSPNRKKTRGNGHAPDPVPAAASPAKPDVVALERYLKSIGVDGDRDPEYSVTAALLSELLVERTSGLRDEAPMLRPITYKGKPGQVVSLEGFTVYGFCPHHLVPYIAEAGVRYVPREQVAGAGALVRFVRDLARVPMLQESLTQGDRRWHPRLPRSGRRTGLDARPPPLHGASGRRIARAVGDRSAPRRAPPRGRGRGARRAHVLAVASVSVVLPTRDRPEFLLEALDAVARQTHLEMELVLVRDGGAPFSDEVRAAVDRLEFPALFEERDEGEGLAQARNRGLARARADVVAFLDDDDLWEPDHLKRLAAAFDRDMEAVVAYSDAKILRESGETRVLAVPFDRAVFGRNGFIPPSAFAARRSAFAEYGLFDASMPLLRGLGLAPPSRAWPAGRSCACRARPRRFASTTAD
jgi:hypothetical protein